MKKVKKKRGKGSQVSLIKTKLKYMKYHRSLLSQKTKIHGKDFLLMHRNSTIGYREYFFFARHRSCMTSKQLEMCVKLTKSRIKDLNKKLKRNKFTLKVYPDLPKTEKGLGVRMGKGKGSVEQWVRPVSKGKILFSIKGINDQEGKYIERGLQYKLRINVGRTFL